jgi:murein DD-endopeptidase MepM/ murein hydrolase activator NlpD
MNVSRSDSPRRSQRFFQLGFDIFRPAGKNKLEQELNIWLGFFAAVLRYVLIRVRSLFLFLQSSFKYLASLFPKAKAFVIKKLIWSRGRLGRSVVMITVMTATIFVFLFGEIFNSSPLVLAQDAEEDYLSVVTDIIPRKEIALTEIPAARKSTEPFSYTIQSGDTLFGIGSKFKISVDAIKYVNSLTDATVLQVGKVLTIPPVSGLIHEVVSGDTLTKIASRYDVPVQAIADFNYLFDTSTLALGTELVIPGAKVPQPVIAYSLPTPGGAPARGAGQPTPSKNYCVWPTTVRYVSQYFTWYHNGLDIASGRGVAMPPLFSCTEGVVTRAGWDSFGLGLHVRISHGDGYETVYGHMSSLNVEYGQRVSRGDVIGWMGNTGNSTGPHVHFMVKYNGAPQNPLNYTN